ncbi:hypothetical protein [Sciscionella marina]|uniref:hypothetical protein n=1 Tax=Sciscionella marina TaxID=508770 RepID=UPI0003613D71|nr:hypothetical protein [Sciscionella marina]
MTHWHAEFVRDAYKDSVLDVITLSEDSLLVRFDDDTAVRIDFSMAGKWSELVGDNA